MSADPLWEIQERLGYRFRDPGRLQRALSHRSWSQAQEPLQPDNERLEFLGDAVLGLVVAEALFREFPDDEGRLTRARASLVRRETLAERARSLDLGSHLRLSKGEIQTGGRDKDSILANALEAVIGAVYADGGMQAAQSFILTLFEEALQRREGDGSVHSPQDPRTLLQERLQAMGMGTPQYRLLGTAGPAHLPMWTLEVGLGDRTLGSGTGRSKQDAARAAAQAALESLV